MCKHKIFKINNEDKVIIFIPTLSKVYLVSKEKSNKIPSYIYGNNSCSTSQVNNLPDYFFLGTNLILTNHCNLACVYCYGNYGPKKNITMKKEVAVAAIDYIAECAKKSDRNLIYANMFGGEPTQAWDIMVTAINYLREKAVEIGCRSRATISTNGCMSLSQAEWLADNLDRISISLDGNKKIQNAHRSNSFDEVFKVAKRIYEIAPKKLGFRSTVSEFSVNDLPETVEFFGKNFPQCNQAYETLFGIGRGQNSKYGAPSYSVFFKKFLESLKIAEKFNCKLRTSVLNLGGINTEFCGIAGRNFMITPDGRCTTCNRMSENSSSENPFSYGHFDPETNSWRFEKKSYQNLKDFSSQSIPECKECFAFSSCRGDCAANKFIIDSKNFWKTKSYRCKEIRDFVKNILLYILEKESLLA
ncbi:hypothetical protein A2995_00020 [Candidatus Nomurabacteria bacterium RIFCSPLOWO2_01_FULL_33_24]|uniref:Radical SAM core domain-containing protein n=1 Tax=Candidatus Nomurabacteria bacterium RIFCSPLOWO2_01_FULL_33_24 TaxID=1801765 RepID=A0A1F6X377_9BACT|nr:MAG: hypothetical protein A2995_00020 [Candidatus Nomurabacteria bacterium RIFCSPLOWO2_01_FULL_33_24]